MFEFSATAGLLCGGQNLEGEIRDPKNLDEVL
jgi:hypothetical protein